jgi:hypothetical protein
MLRTFSSSCACAVVQQPRLMALSNKLNEREGSDIFFMGTVSRVQQGMVQSMREPLRPQSIKTRT